MPRFRRALCWFRRDLRTQDHAALYHALKHSAEVIPVFIFDRDILDALPANDGRVSFLWQSLLALQTALRQMGGDLRVQHARAVDALPALAAEWGAEAVFANHDYEPAAMARDAEVASRLQAQGATLLTFKDQVIFERDEVLTQAGKPFSVFTPYKNAWLKQLDSFYQQSYPVARYQASLLALPAQTLPSLATLGFAEAGPA